ARFNVAETVDGVYTSLAFSSVYFSSLRNLRVLCVSAVKLSIKPQRRRGRRGYAERKTSWTVFNYFATLSQTQNTHKERSKLQPKKEPRSPEARAKAARKVPRRARQRSPEKALRSQSRRQPRNRRRRAEPVRKAQRKRQRNPRRKPARRLQRKAGLKKVRRSGPGSLQQPSLR